jgi:hypothetical protein
MEENSFDSLVGGGVVDLAGGFHVGDFVANVCVYKLDEGSRGSRETISFKKYQWTSQARS